MPNTNISVPYGIVNAVEYYLASVGILDLIDAFKGRGISMSRMIVAVCVCILMGSNSMQRCSDWLSDVNVRKEFGIDGKVSQRTINRAVELIGEHAGELISKPSVIFSQGGEKAMRYSSITEQRVLHRSISMICMTDMI